MLWRKPSYNDGDNPAVLKSEFLLSLCERSARGKLSAKENYH